MLFPTPTRCRNAFINEHISPHSRKQSINEYACIVFFQLQPLMMSVYHWSAIMSSVRFLPCGLAGTATAIVAPMLLNYSSPKWTISVGLTMQFIGTMVLPFADTSVKFWSHCLPAFIMYVKNFPSFSFFSLVTKILKQD